MDIDLQKAFDDALMVVNAMTDDAARLREKFGESSQLFKDRLHQIEVIKNLYRASAAFINNSQEQEDGAEKIIKIQQMNINVLQAVAFKNEVGLPWRKLGVILGDPNPERWEIIDRVDDIIRQAEESTAKWRDRLNG